MENLVDILLEASGKILNDTSPEYFNESDDLRKYITKNYSEEIWAAIRNNMEIVEKNLDVQKMRWYEYSGSIWKLDDRYIYVEGISQMFNEMSSISDAGEQYNIMEVWPHKVTTTEYKTRKPEL